MAERGRGRGRSRSARRCARAPTPSRAWSCPGCRSRCQPGSTLRFPDAFLLQATLEAGRALVEAPSLDALKIVTDEAEVRGRGRAVVRRQARSTLVTCLAGRFMVEAARSVVTLQPGQGTVVVAGQPPSAPQGVLEAPTEGLWPALDPVFVTPDEPLELRWKGNAPGYQLELLPVGSDVVLLQRDVDRPAGQDRDPLARSLPLARLRARRPRPRRPALCGRPDRGRPLAAFRASGVPRKVRCRRVRGTPLSRPVVGSVSVDPFRYDEETADGSVQIASFRFDDGNEPCAKRRWRR